MKKEQRQIYRDILNLGDFGLCNACRFAEWDGWSPCESTIDCQHPLIRIEPGRFISKHDTKIEPFDVWAGGDCWLFQPDKTPLTDLAAMASISHEGAWPHKNKRGEWVAITGVQV